MQFSQFKNGGYVLHKIPHDGQIYSAWFDVTGTMIDLERTTGRRVSQVSERYHKVRTAIQAIGLRNKPVVSHL